MDVGNAQAVRIIYLLKLRFIVDHAAVLTEIFHALGQGNAAALTEIVEIAHNRGALTERHFSDILKLGRGGKLGFG